jgi:hypothetical protein
VNTALTKEAIYGKAEENRRPPLRELYEKPAGKAERRKTDAFSHKS